MMFSATFNNISAIYRDCQFYWWRKPEYTENITDIIKYRKTNTGGKHEQTTREIKGWCHGVILHFQQYFSYEYIVAVLLVEETGEDHRPAPSH